MLLNLINYLIDTEIEEDGVHHEYLDEDAPKTIDSDELKVFECEFFTDEEDEKCGKYILYASLDETNNEGSYTFIEKDSNLKAITFCFETNEGFMKQVDRILKEGNALSLNGFHENTDGLPEGYGYDLEACYALGERISSSSNSENSLSREMTDKLISLFYDCSEAYEYYDTDELQNVYYHIYEKDNESYWANIFMEQDGLIRYQITESGKDKVQKTKEGITDQEILLTIDKIRNVYRLNEIETYPRRESDRYITLELKHGEYTEYIRSNTAISDEQYEALESIRYLIDNKCR